MRKLLLLSAVALVSSLFPMASGCSNTHIKKHVPGTDASTGDGSVVADSCDAGGIFNYQSNQCESCPAVVDAGMPGMCPPDAPPYRCNLTCADVDFSKSGIDTTNQQIHVAFTNYPLAITGVSAVYFAIDATAADGGYLDADNTTYPTSMDHNILTMDLSKMPAAEFASITAIMPSGIELTDACGRPNSEEALDFGFNKSGSTFTGSCIDAGMPLDAGL